MRRKILGIPALFCDERCAEAFQQDRMDGLNYGLHKVNGVLCLHRDEWSLVTSQCAYCDEFVESKVPNELLEKFNISQSGE